MAVEKYIAAASLGLFVMFVGEILSIYNFMQDAPDQVSSSLVLEPDPKILQFISIGIAPALIMAAVSFIMSKRYGSKPIGMMIIAGGAVLLVGMIIAHFFAEGIDSAYESEFIPIITPLFIAVSIPVMIVGARLLKIKPRRTKKDYF